MSAPFVRHACHGRKDLAPMALLVAGIDKTIVVTQWRASDFGLVRYDALVLSGRPPREKRGASSPPSEPLGSAESTSGP
jgi:hypothetical protein